MRIEVDYFMQTKQKYSSIVKTTKMHHQILAYGHLDMQMFHLIFYAVSMKYVFIMCRPTHTVFQKLPF